MYGLLFEYDEEVGWLIVNIAVDAVLSGALDTVWLPAVAVDRCLYRIHPPLVALVDQHRYDELERRLESGRNPDQVLRRYSELTPIQYALERMDIRAFDLLVKHGAQVSRTQVTSPRTISLELACCAFENDVYEQTPPEGNRHVHEWCVEALGYIPDLERDNADKLEIILVKLLKAGYSVESSSEYRKPATALDLVLMSLNLSRDVKDRLEKALREAGAETYPEKVAKDPSLPHLDLRGKNIDPMFARFLHVLQCAECPEGILVATALPGIPSDVPVLVVDFKSAHKEWESSKKLTWALGEATKSAQWTEGAVTRTREIPVGARLIVVPDQVEIPSQVVDVPNEILQQVRFKVPGFNILFLRNDPWAHPAIGMTIGRFALLDRKRYRQFVERRPKSDN